MTLTLAQAAKWLPQTESAITMLSLQWRAALTNRPRRLQVLAQIWRGFRARPSQPK